MNRWVTRLIDVALILALIIVVTPILAGILRAFALTLAER